MRSRLAFATIFLVMLLPLAATAQGVDCLKCHAKLKKDKVVHAAMEMGCPTCHTDINAAKVPHKNTGKIARGLSAEQPELCYSCHDRALFSKKNLHAAVGMGCTGCHNPHSSKNAKLLVSEAPDLCYTCHDKAGFSKKTVHSPVAGGMCLSCHTPHSSDEMALLSKKPVEVCLECHPDVTKKPHAISGFSSAKRHPLGVPKRVKKKDKDKMQAELKDPTRPDKPFYCGSCHEPHSSNGPTLFRFNAPSAPEICTTCHKM